MGVDRNLCRAVFLDRDGVINRAIVKAGKPHPPSSLDELEVLPGVLEALCQLRAAGFTLIVVTNQPDVARGTQTRNAVEGIHEWLANKLPIDEFRACYHDDVDGCECRKPQPGLLLAAAKRLGLDLTSSVMVGDRWRDIEAGKRAGCKTVFIDYGYAERRPDAPDATVASLAEAAIWIVSRQGGAANETS